MADPNTQQDEDKALEDKALVDSLLAIAPAKFDVWKYFEERANYLSYQMWSLGTWLMGLLAATLSLPFAARFVEFPSAGFSLHVVAPLPVGAISAFGMALCAYAYMSVADVRRHIEDNWRRAGYARTGEWAPASWTGRRRHGWNILVAVGILAFAAFLALFVSALVS